MTGTNAGAMTGVIADDLARVRYLRAFEPGEIALRYADRRRRSFLGTDGRLLLVAADHPARGALGESARGGGCLALASVDAPSLAAAVGRLLAAPAELASLAAAARARRFRTWPDYAAALTAWMRTVPRRN